MKVINLFFILATFLSVAALQAADPPPLPSYLQSANTFYRAVTGQEVDQVASIYQIGKSPTKYSSTPGDFSYSGALYVFKDIDQAKQWGTCRAKIQQDPKKKFWYLVELGYTPNSGLKTLTFKEPTPQWKQFVLDNYKKQGPLYDIIEGPISVGSGDRLQAYVTDGHMVWQGAFVGQDALHTLIVKAVTKYDDKGPVKECCNNCNIQ